MAFQPDWLYTECVANYGVLGAHVACEVCVELERRRGGALRAAADADAACTGPAVTSSSLDKLCEKFNYSFRLDHHNCRDSELSPSTQPEPTLFYSFADHSTIINYVIHFQ